VIPALTAFCRSSSGTPEEPCRTSGTGIAARSRAISSKSSDDAADRRCPDVAGHDHQAAAIGVGALHPGDQLDSCGTAEALVRAIKPGLPPSAIADLAVAGITTAWHATAARWCLLGATQGGLALQRVLALLGKGTPDLPELCWLTAVSMIESGTLPLDRICSHQLPLTEFRTGLDLVGRGAESVKVTLLP